MSPWSGAQADRRLAGSDSAPLLPDRWKHLTLAQRRREAPKRLMPQLLDAPAPLPPIAYHYTEITPQLCAEAQGHQIEAARRTHRNTPLPRKPASSPGDPQARSEQTPALTGCGLRLAGRLRAGAEAVLVLLELRVGPDRDSTAPASPRPLKGPAPPPPPPALPNGCSHGGGRAALPKDHGSPRRARFDGNRSPRRSEAPHSPQAEKIHLSKPASARHRRCRHTALRPYGSDPSPG